MTGSEDFEQMKTEYDRLAGRVGAIQLLTLAIFDSIVGKELIIREFSRLSEEILATGLYSDISEAGLSGFQDAAKELEARMRETAGPGELDGVP